MQYLHDQSPLRAAVTRDRYTMSPDQQKELKKLQDEATAALKRAAQRARELARQTGTKIVVMRDGELVKETPQAEWKDESA